MTELIGMTVVSAASMLTCGGPELSMDGEQLFRAHLATVEQAIARVCRRAGLQGADADDFASEARLALIEHDYAMVRSFRGDCAPSTYFTVIVQNVLSDLRERTLGRFRPSVEAKRVGEVAVVLERLVVRDGRPVEEALPIARNCDPSLTRDAAERILARLPERSRRPRAVDLVEGGVGEQAAAARADDRVAAEEAQRLSAKTNRVVREVLAGLVTEDRLLLRLRFDSGLSIADISRMLRLPQRPLYRRIESLLDRLRRALQAEGLDVRSLTNLIGDAHAEMDFGLNMTGEVCS
jgi:RNA polymerase sigma factor (sigma-70 family)